MAEQAVNRYEPDTVSPPGETLLETLEMKGLSQAQLAELTGRPKQAINEIIRGKKEITAETALQLESVLGVPARFWLAREQNYRESLARQAQAERLEEQTGLLRMFPLKEMISLGWLPKRDTLVEQLQELLQYFGVAGPDELTTLCLHTQAKFRKSEVFKADTGALNAWLRRGEIVGHNTQTADYDKEAFLAALQEARGLTREKPSVFAGRLKEICAAAGVVVALVPELPRIRTSGATRWLTKEKALIQLSLRFKWADQIWFSFFHEAGHIVLHGKRDVFLEDGVESEQEVEADRFASDTLVSPDNWRSFVDRADFRGQVVRQFAEALGIHPCIVVGRLQHEKHIHYRQLAQLKPRIVWKKA